MQDILKVGIVIFAIIILVVLFAEWMQYKDRQHMRRAKIDALRDLFNAGMLRNEVSIITIGKQFDIQIVSVNQGWRVCGEMKALSPIFFHRKLAVESLRNHLLTIAEKGAI